MGFGRRGGRSAPGNSDGRNDVARDFGAARTGFTTIGELTPTGVSGLRLPHKHWGFVA
jgi:hypothetical protein